MEKRRGSDKATTEDWLAVILALVVMLAPIIAIVGFPTNRVVHALFGEGRIVIFWAAIVAVVLTYRRKIDEFASQKIARYKKK